MASPVSDITTPGLPATGNVLDNTTEPAGTTSSVVSFRVPGSDSPVLPGSNPVPLVDPATGTVTGTLTIKADGAYVFTPLPGYSGPVPAVTVAVTSSDGQVKETKLSIVVNPLLRDGNEDVTTPVGVPITANLLANVSPPPGTTVAITSFSLPGSNIVYPVGQTPVTMVDPVTGRTTGTVAMLANGTSIFTPASGFSGQAPPVTYMVDSSDGQVSPGTLLVTVQPCELWPAGSWAPPEVQAPALPMRACWHCRNQGHTYWTLHAGPHTHHMIWYLWWSDLVPCLVACTSHGILHE